MGNSNGSSNGNSSGNADQCTRDMMSYSALCALQPKSQITQCLKEASQYHGICISSGVSSGDGCSSLNSSLGASPYRKSDDRVYINSGGGELPFNGRVWNGKCEAYYTNGEVTHWRDRNDNPCDNEGVLYSNNFN